MRYQKEISMSYGDLMGQASKTARQYLIEAKAHVDDLMGHGAAQKHPELVAALVQASATDYVAAMLSHRVVPELAMVVQSIDNLAEIVERLGEDWPMPDDGSGDPGQF